MCQVPQIGEITVNIKSDDGSPLDEYQPSLGE